MKTQAYFRIALAGTLALLLATLSSAQWWCEWTKFEENPVIAPNLITWFDQVNHPVILQEEGIYKVWFTGWSEANTSRDIGYAESLDGIIWSIHPEPVISTNLPNAWDRHKYPGTVLRVDDTLRMWYTGFNNFTPFAPCIGYAWSLDGIEWNPMPYAALQKGEAGDWDEELVENPSIHFDGATYHMWYDSRSAIGYATSMNGSVWEKDETHNPVIQLGTEGSFYEQMVFAGPLIQMAGMLHMFFSGRDINDREKTGHAWSDNMVGWMVTQNPVLTGDPGSWDEGSLILSSIFEDQGMIRAWYGGTADIYEPAYSIGLATAGLVAIPAPASMRHETISVIPNPSRKGYFRIEYPDVPAGSGQPVLTIYNAMGQKVYTETLTGEKSTRTVNTRDWDSGVYVMVAFVEGKAISKLIVILE